MRRLDYDEDYATEYAIQSFPYYRMYIKDEKKCCESWLWNAKVFKTKKEATKELVSLMNERLSVYEQNVKKYEEKLASARQDMENMKQKLSKIQK